MAQYITIKELYNLKKQFPVIDVRSPAEFQNGHIPDAKNIPIFSNEERALVGTRYKKSGKDFAIELGLEIVGPKMVSMVQEAKKMAVDKTLILYCWRGGMRSSSMAWLFETSGLNIYIIKSGYKAYRHFNRSAFSKAQHLIVLSGHTGSGKTDILKSLEKFGHQIIDLEGLANHKGSAYGHIGQQEQSTNEQFENNLAQAWSALDLNKTIWIEDESVNMGKNGVPDTLFNIMRTTKVIRIDISQHVRAKRLVKEYACFSKEKLAEATRRIESRLGGLKTKEALKALENNEYELVAEITLVYYDKAYLKGLEKRKPESIIEVKINEDNPDKTAKILIDTLNA
jgi:tRNA 2-selenouridine synthase